MQTKPVCMSFRLDQRCMVVNYFAPAQIDNHTAKLSQHSHSCHVCLHACYQWKAKSGQCWLLMDQLAAHGRGARENDPANALRWVQLNISKKWSPSLRPGAGRCVRQCVVNYDTRRVDAPAVVCCSRLCRAPNAWLLSRSSPSFVTMHEHCGCVKVSSLCGVCLSGWWFGCDVWSLMRRMCTASLRLNRLCGLRLLASTRKFK